MDELVAFVNDHPTFSNKLALDLMRDAMRRYMQAEREMEHWHDRWSEAFGLIEADDDFEGMPERAVFEEMYDRLATRG